MTSTPSVPPSGTESSRLTMVLRWTSWIFVLAIAAIVLDLATVVASLLYLLITSCTDADPATVLALLCVRSAAIGSCVSIVLSAFMLRVDRWTGQRTLFVAFVVLALLGLAGLLVSSYELVAQVINGNMQCSSFRTSPR